MKSVKIVITLKVPEEFTGIACWSAESALQNLVEHWLTEGYYANDGLVELPEGIEYEGFEIDGLA